MSTPSAPDRPHWPRRVLPWLPRRMTVGFLVAALLVALPALLVGNWIWAAVRFAITFVVLSALAALAWRVVGTPDWWDDTD
jgi:hypothetical protein